MILLSDKDFDYFVGTCNETCPPNKALVDAAASLEKKKMILLTVEETASIIHRCEGTVKDARTEVNKAQLKKVGELVEKKIATLNQRAKELEELRAPIIRKLDGGWTEGDDKFMVDSLHEIYTSIPYAIQAFEEFEQVILKEIK